MSVHHLLRRVPILCNASAKQSFSAIGDLSDKFNMHARANDVLDRYISTLMRDEEGVCRSTI